MLSILTGIVGGAIVVRMFLLFKRISKSENPESVIMQIVVLMFCAATIPFMISFFMDKN